jgi:hypothetical protein
MKPISVTASPRSIVSKRAVFSVLLGLLGIAALLGGADSVLNSAGLLTLFWPLSMIALASYWLRVLLNEREDLDYGNEFKVKSHISSSGLYLAPMYLIRS